METTAKLQVKMPLRLANHIYYNSVSKCYCAIGYLVHHLCGVSPTAHRVGAWSEGIVELDRLTGKNTFDSDIMSRNDNAGTQKARLAAFRESCQLLGIEVIER